ncbi:MAG: UDP-N-acetylmuramate dehydrogenase [Actinobacteria bacterium]|uniref:UDP-N-acetylmuramate dehydrogenase n=1 Tax=freshwater metagenome TaxID=449393 RepID=A0A6J6AL32_9ZZZZ|nr:UDP-N-acetylmuramate dehydrogenase [Actinomycetota bacterium]MSX33801.1 UDP-N-acetylmuramate dehydrogenase [Actinomycetota bacterium]MSX95587.1 UDP-N-acetylmuramate dehydrogenase [Actinomycetota bacterium]MTA41889.1 UDP-N-acetylmuramate dehydrogenase [Actinomycetota bacterium]MTA44308.1 UDP-N-acetylmuramate dehydrogenase [Actinomycetota bacterium]
MSFDAVFAALQNDFGDRVALDAGLGEFTTYRVGGRAAIRVRAESPGDVSSIGKVIAKFGSAFAVIGRGSNLLVADEGFHGIAVTLGEGLAGITITGTTVHAGGAALLPVVARRTAAAGLTGFEWAVGVPGSIGGAVRMNAGGHGSDMAQGLVGVRVVDLASGDHREMSLADLGLGFRSSTLGRSLVVTDVELALSAGDRATAEAEISEIVRWRRENQPGGSNAGSVFVNPLPDSAGRLVDEAGAKGLRLRSAEVSTKHANFIQVDDGGSANDVAELMALVRAQVHERTGVDLHAETHFLGFSTEATEAAGARRVEAIS